MFKKIEIGVTLIIIGLFIIFSDFIVIKRNKVFDLMNSYLYTLESKKEKVEIESNKEIVLSTELSSTTDYQGYLGILNIPKINFNKGFYESNSKLNNVKNNIYLLPESSMPDILNGNLIIAGHSGNYTNSFFQNIYKLKIGDTIIIDYQGKLYKYEIAYIYDIKKNGKAKIVRDENRTTITLITCKKDDNNMQTIYIGYMV